MDSRIVIEAIDSVAVVLSIGIVGWTIVAFTRARRGKSVAGAPTPELLQPMEQRLQRLEQITEAIALQVERIAEGQRFVTKLLSDAEHQSPRIGAPR